MLATKVATNRHARRCYITKTTRTRSPARPKGLVLRIDSGQILNYQLVIKDIQSLIENYEYLYTRSFDYPRLVDGGMLYISRCTFFGVQILISYYHGNCI